ncbi:hypothetical protein [Muricoccus pecuniae]|uniref:Putative RNA-binding Zn ribbon-like protein n=1 Tax=Muricoccus pecuniae TaxID=693023 RepID=A0A840YCR7_9PROT|nr:hypothetical protein [Roseomonas pecuniae]MBB5696479.1 putative RNA-binding Zn ribbon-like protein [Roseomonas pecuniae]
MRDEERGATIPGESTTFVVTVNGEGARCDLVIGLEGVHEALLRALWSGPREALPRDLAEHLASLREPAAWAVHGAGDGQPFWHWWAGLGERSVSVQRLTGPMPFLPSAKAALQEAVTALISCAADLRLAVEQRRGALRICRDNEAR